MDNHSYIIEKVAELRKKIAEAASTFIYNPVVVEECAEEVRKIQEQCEHEYENGVCKYCGKSKGGRK